MNKVFYCQSCRKLYAYEESELHVCKYCGQRLAISNISANDFAQMSNKQKLQIKQQLFGTSSHSSSHNNSYPGKYLCIVFAILFIILGLHYSNVGFDKINHYSNDLIHKNAYVGGDAYNYIINGTYTIAYFVKSTGYFICSVISIMTRLVIKSIYKN